MEDAVPREEQDGRYEGVSDNRDSDVHPLLPHQYPCPHHPTTHP